MAIGDKAYKRRRQRRKDKESAQLAREQEKTKRKQARQETARQFLAGAGKGLGSSQEFIHSQVEQTRDRGTASQAHIQEVAPELAGAYLQGQMGIPMGGTTTGTTVATSAGLPKWAVPAAAAGAGLLWFSTRKN